MPSIVKAPNIILAICRLLPVTWNHGVLLWYTVHKQIPSQLGILCNWLLTFQILCETIQQRIYGETLRLSVLQQYLATSYLSYTALLQTRPEQIIIICCIANLAWSDPVVVQGCYRLQYKHPTTSYQGQTTQNYNIANQLAMER